MDPVPPRSVGFFRGPLLPADRRGIAATEFALVAGIVVVMLVAAFDLGLWIWQRMQLESALMAGVHYAQVFPSDTAGITSAINAALPPALFGGAAIGAPSLSRDCGPDNPASPDNGTCSPGTPRTFVSLSLSYPFSPLYFTAITNNEVQYAVRVQ